jgi:predicted nuclease of predicted toxin-antitoxin system
MKLLVDQNISQRILPLLAHEFEAVDHVRQLNLTDADDYRIFMYARENGYRAVITADEDFIKLINQFSQPPKIVWIRTGNCATAVLSALLNEKVQMIKDFIDDDDFDIYEIFKS